MQRCCYIQWEVPRWIKCPCDSPKGYTLQWGKEGTTVLSHWDECLWILEEQFSFMADFWYLGRFVFLISERHVKGGEKKGPNKLVKSPAMVNKRPTCLRQRGEMLPKVEKPRGTRKQGQAISVMEITVGQWKIWHLCLVLKNVQGCHWDKGRGRTMQVDRT